MENLRSILAENKPDIKHDNLIVPLVIILFRGFGASSVPIFQLSFLLCTAALKLRYKYSPLS